MKKIPYGVGNYKLLRNDNYYFIDKTKFIEEIENLGSRYLFFLRPRKFGKSLFLSMLEYYYDILAKDEFETLFSDTYIGKNPTPLKNSYPILKFDFSGIPVGEGIDQAKAGFNLHVKNSIRSFFTAYRNHLPQEVNNMAGEILSIDNATGMLDTFISIMKDYGINYYLLIDEYDNFANNILVHHSRGAYRETTHAGGFLRSFFAVIKNGAQNLSIDRMFIVGVSPLVLSDITSGMNIGKNISMLPQFDTMVGITEEELDEILNYYISHNKIPENDREKLLATLREYANNYRFSVRDKRLYNTDMVLYILDEYMLRQEIPPNPIDPNIRTDYDKLRFLIIEGNKLNGNFKILEEILETGETTGSLTDSFALGELIDPEKFKSLLYHLGLISIGKTEEGGIYTFTIPNLTIKEQLWEYIRKALKEEFKEIKIDIDKLIKHFRTLAYQGEWKDLFNYLLEEFYKIVSVRDFIWKEEGIKMFLLTYLNITSLYKITSEYDTGTGFSDIYLEKNWVIAPKVKYEYIVELKHLKREEAKKEQSIENARKDGITQLKRYASQIESKVPEYMKDNPDIEVPVLKKILLIVSPDKPLIVEEVE